MLTYIIYRSNVSSILISPRELFIYGHIYHLEPKKEKCIDLSSLPSQTRMMTILPTHKANYSSVPSALVSIARTEKPRTLFRGMTVVATAAGPAHALYFSLYEMIKKAVSDKNSVVSQGVSLCVCVGGGGVCVRVCVNVCVCM